MIKEKNIRWIFFLSTYITGCFILNSLVILDKFSDFMGLFFIGTGSFIIVHSCSNIFKNKTEKIMVMAGYILRLFILFADRIPIKVVAELPPVASGDAQGFWNTAVAYYRGVLTEEYTKYPYFIAAIIRIFGENRIIAQYINILLYMGSAVLVYKIFELIDVKGNARKISIILLSFWPWNIILSGILLRESLVWFFSTLSIYYFTKNYIEYRTKYYICMISSVMISMIFHTGTIMLLVSYIVFFAFWDAHKRKLHIQKKTIIQMCLFFITILAVWNISFLKQIFLSKIPLMQEDVFSYLNYLISPDLNAGSNYLGNMRTDNYVQLILNTFIRMIYFNFSPMPWDWRGWADALTFIMDSCFYLAIYILGIFTFIKNKKKRAYLGCMLLSCFLTVAVFAWGVCNAGTAARHRDKLVFLMVIILGYCLSRKNGEKGRGL